MHGIEYCVCTNDPNLITYNLNSIMIVLCNFTFTFSSSKQYLLKLKGKFNLLGRGLHQS